MKFNTLVLPLDNGSKRSKRTSTASGIELLIVPVVGSRLVGPSAAWANQVFNGELEALLKAGDLDEKAANLIIHRQTSGASQGLTRAMLVSLGKDKDQVSEKVWNEACTAVGKALAQTPCKKVVFALHEAQVQVQSQAKSVRNAVLKLREVAYRFEAMKSKALPASKLSEISFVETPTEKSFNLSRE